MEDSVFRRPYDLSDEANPYGYTESEPFNEVPSTPSAGDAASRGKAAVPRLRQPPCTGPPPKRDLMAMTRVVNMTDTLQTDQAAKEKAAKAEAKIEAERLRQERNAKWEAVKASMSARPTPLHTVRAYDSDVSDSGEEEERQDWRESRSDVQSMRSLRSTRSTATTTAAAGGRRTALDALVPTLTEERAARAGALYAVESVPQRVMHFLYNWWMYFVYAISSSVVPGMDSRKGADSREYFNRKQYA